MENRQHAWNYLFHLYYPSLGCVRSEKLDFLVQVLEIIGLEARRLGVQEVPFEAAADLFKLEGRFLCGRPMQMRGFHQKCRQNECKAYKQDEPDRLKLI